MEEVRSTIHPNRPKRESEAIQPNLNSNKPIIRFLGQEEEADEK